MVSYRGFLQAVQEMVMLGLKSGVGLTYQSLTRLFRCLLEKQKTLLINLSEQKEAKRKD